jgi:hypothetical protein
MFAGRNRMTEILENLPGKDLDEYCICGKKKLFYTFIIVKY